MLLSDISEEERKEAMAFYEDYFADAGEANEARIIEELVSPEHVAETIKRDLGMVTVVEAEATGSAYNEQGTANQRTYENAYGNEDKHHEDNYNQRQQNDGTYYRWSESQQANTHGNYYDQHNAQTNDEKKNSWLKPLLIVIAVFTFPTWFGILAGVTGTAIGLLAALVGITIAMFVVGIVFVGLGIAMLSGLSAAVVSIPAGLAFVGAGLLVLAFALLLLLACTGVFGKFIPWGVREIGRLCKKLFAKKEA